MKVFIFLIVTFTLAACASAESRGEPEASTVTTAATIASVVSVSSPAVVSATRSPVEATEPPPTATFAPTETPLAAATATRGDDQPPAVVYGRTGDGAFFHGAPDAPVTLIDYSDFL